jgi:putative oxidoreductase
MGSGLLLLRLVVGAAFVGHGTQKLFGWFGGHGPQGTGGFFSSVGYRAGVAMAVAAGVAETSGGTLLALGFLTPLAGALLAVVMINAIVAVTFKRAFMFGSELEIAYLTVAVALAATGAGRFSIDNALGWWGTFSGFWWGVGAFGVAALVSLFTLTVGRTRAARQEAAAST